MSLQLGIANCFIGMCSEVISEQQPFSQDTIRFNDVDVMSYEEIVAPQKTIDTDEVRNDIEKRQQQMQRKCDFLLRRLRKIQARSMGKHTSEEISGLFEWTNRLIRRKDHEQLPDICYDEDKHRPVTQAAMRGLLRRIDSIALAQHSSPANGLVASAVINSGQKKKNKSDLRVLSSYLIRGRDHRSGGGDGDGGCEDSLLLHGTRFVAFDFVLISDDASENAFSADS